MRELELVIFDIAGTTVDDRGQVPAAFGAALEAHGFHITPEQVNSVRGASKREALRSFVPPGPEQVRIAGEVYASFRANLVSRFASEGVHAMPGAVDAFCTLRERGIRVALNTGFDRDTTGTLLAALGWGDGMVDAVVCGDDVTMGRPAPYLIFHAMEATGVLRVDCVANVGDTCLDLWAGCNARVRWNVGVLSGAHERRSLERAPHTHILPSVADLTDLWRN